MRWYIVRTLVYKEMLRHLANRGGVVMIVLLIAGSLLLTFFRLDPGSSGGLAPGVRMCFVDYWSEGRLIDHLRATVPDAMENQIKFRLVGSGVDTDRQGRIVYPQNVGAIQIRSQANDLTQGPLQVSFWYPGTEAYALAPYEAWFWKEAFRFRQIRAGDSSASIPTLDADHQELKGGLDSRSLLSTSLVLFGLFFVCVYLMPSMCCEERERGLLLAQMLSPASAVELLAARFLFYPVVALGLAVLLAGMYRPAVLLVPFFWLALLVSVIGSMGIGLTIASLARSQRAASMGAMCYMLTISLFGFICQQNRIPVLPLLSLEYHSPRMLHAVLTDSVLWYHWAHLLGAGVLAFLWTAVAAVLFRRYGWQ